jgi:hypothetical protein
MFTSIASDMLKLLWSFILFFPRIFLIQNRFDIQKCHTKLCQVIIPCPSTSSSYVINNQEKKTCKMWYTKCLVGGEIGIQDE